MNLIGDHTVPISCEQHCLSFLSSLIHFFCLYILITAISQFYCFACPCIHPFIYYLSIYSSIYMLLVHPFIHLYVTCPSIYMLLVHSFIHLYVTCPSIHPFVCYLSIHLYVTCPFFRCAFSGTPKFNQVKCKYYMKL